MKSGTRDTEIGVPESYQRDVSPTLDWWMGGNTVPLELLKTPASRVRMKKRLVFLQVCKPQSPSHHDIPHLLLFG
jgi:hypothetical protein